jgi:holliday junction DNA helicase RuvB
MKRLINKLNNLLDLAISILEPNPGYVEKLKIDQYNAMSYIGVTSLLPNNTEDLFKGIFGHDNVKSIFRMALRSCKPAHVVLTSPPGMAKTQFLLAIRDILENRSCFIIGSNSTKKGIIDLLFERRPQILLIDELETMSYDAQESLLNVMETGIISETKKTCTRELQIEDIKVFATSNNTKNLITPLLSRFIVIDIPPYTDQQFLEIAVRKLTIEEGISEEFARNIARQVIQKVKQKDLRDCIKVARITKTPEEIECVISIMRH